MIKKYATEFLIGALLGSMGFVFANTIRIRVEGQNSSTMKTVTIATSSSSYTIPQSVVYPFGVDNGNQGACLKVKDTGGNGWTYLTTLNGVLIPSTTSCE